MIVGWGIAAAALDLVSFVPYVLGVLRRGGRPQRASWAIWAGLYAVITAAQLAHGARASLGLSAGEALGALIVFVLSVRRGTGGLDRNSLLATGGALVALVVWAVTRSPGLAIVLAVAVDLAAGVLTAGKAYRDGGESRASWWLFGCAAVATVPAVGRSGAPILYLYPVVSVATAAVVLLALGARSGTAARGTLRFLAAAAAVAAVAVSGVRVARIAFPPVIASASPAEAADRPPFPGRLSLPARPARHRRHRHHRHVAGARSAAASAAPVSPAAVPVPVPRPRRARSPRPSPAPSRTWPPPGSPLPWPSLTAPSSTTPRATGP